MQQDHNSENDDECNVNTEEIVSNSMREDLEISKCAIGSNSGRNNYLGSNGGTKTFHFNKSKRDQLLCKIICNEDIPGLFSSDLKAICKESPMTCSIPVHFDGKESRDSLAPSPTHANTPKQAHVL